MKYLLSHGNYTQLAFTPLDILEGFIFCGGLILVIITDLYVKVLRSTELVLGRTYDGNLCE